MTWFYVNLTGLGRLLKRLIGFVALDRFAPVGLWHMAYSVWFVCSNYMP